MEIKIAHLYPELLNLYGDRGNIISLVRRCEWRGVGVNVQEIKSGESVDFSKFDIVFLGGGSDREQEIVGRNLSLLREGLLEFVERGGVVIAICGGYQLLGESYYMGDEQVDGLRILDIVTKRGDKRMIGNVAIKVDFLEQPIVGFENHGGATFLGEEASPLGEVLFGHGNRGGADEGVRYKNVFGTYLHGPLLPKNPHLCDYFLSLAGVDITPLDDEAEMAANGYILKRFGHGN